MAALARGDAEQLLRFVAEAESIGGDQPFTPDLLVELGRLVPADCVIYSELDRVPERSLLACRPARRWKWTTSSTTRSAGGCCWRSIRCAYASRQGYFGALKVSDFLTQRELHRTWVYDNFLAPFHTEYELEVPLPSPLWHTKTFLFGRGGGRDFTERDRLLLDLLQPHLGADLARSQHASTAELGTRRARPRGRARPSRSDPARPRR